MLVTLTLVNHPLWIAFSGHSMQSSPKWEASGSFCLITDLRRRILHLPKQRQFAAAGKENGQEPRPRFQGQEKCAAAATKGKTKDKTSRPAQPIVPVRQELSSACGSEGDGISQESSAAADRLPGNERTILRRHAVLRLEQVPVS
jgi:hypothetical protein